MQTTEEINDAAVSENPPPGRSMENGDIALQKGDIIALYNHWTQLWSVKRVVKASKPTSSYNREVWQPEVNYVRHDAIPMAGKSGASRNHYEGNPGFGQGGTRTFQKDGALPWYLVDMSDPRAREWIAEQDQLWVDYADDEQAEQDRVAGTPVAFVNRMNRLADQATYMANKAQDLADGFREMAQQLRGESKGEWTR